MVSAVSQLSPLRPITRYITGHTPAGLATIHTENPAIWSPFENNSMAFTVPYTTSSFPADLNADADIATHESLMSTGNLGLVNPGGTVCRIVDFAPRGRPIMHRTQSLDYGIVLEGEIEMALDSGEKRILRKGDVAIQRGTMHAWFNPSETEWARVVFVLQETNPLSVGGRELGEDLSNTVTGDIKPSR
ncbi:cupin domain-containing protein [Aspergillus undulatus]|uniref:cupin domain-containing protein n=1 Tax=Aspergillus undulatus TaxID=1810928 RepID=UPI003CCD5C50